MKSVMSTAGTTLYSGIVNLEVFSFLLLLLNFV